MTSRQEEARLRFNDLRNSKRKGKPYTDEELSLLYEFDYWRWKLATDRRSAAKTRPARDYSTPGQPPVPRSREWRSRMSEHRKKLDAVWTAPSFDSSEHGRICRAMSNMLVEEVETGGQRQAEHHACGAGDGQDAGGQL